MPCQNHLDVEDGLRVCSGCGLAYCDDCLVALQGEELCAECKTEKVRDIQSGVEAGEVVLAGILARFAAFFLDGVILSVVFWLPLWFIFGISMLSFAEELAAAPAAGRLLLVLAIGTIAQIVYEGVLLQRTGQTLGKMALKIKVVTPEGRDITAGQAWGRTLIRNGFNVAGAYVPLATLVDYVPAFVTKTKTCIHDMGAATRVIKLTR